jgi:kynurenine formamidase/predicted enzyme related to lactoylglutathione lyase
MARYVDLSHDITEGMQTYPGLPGPRTATVLSREDSRSRYAEGTEFHIGSVELCTNTGTYLDTPFHRYADGHDLAGLDLARCADLPATVIHVKSGEAAIGPETIGDMDVEGRALLFDTGWSAHWGSDEYFSNTHPFLTESTVDALIEGGAALVGIDSLNIDSTIGGERPAHTKLLARGIPIVEHLTNLSELPATGATFTAVPPKLAGLGTFTVRAFAIVPDDLHDARNALCGIVVDCHDPAALAGFWSHVLHGEARVRSEQWATVRDPLPGGVLLAFQRVPEAKSVKNRVHLDIWTTDLRGDTDRLVAAGGTTVGAIVDEDDGPFQIMQDPEGNEFCLVT